MSKSQALGWAIVCVGAAVLFAVIGLSVISPACFIVAAGFGLRCGYQFLRDANLAAEAAKVASRQPLEVTPSVTSPGNSRLFIPPPLDRV